MKNYICINGKKTELTEKQLKQLGIENEPKAILSEDGKTVKIGDYEFIILKRNKDTVEVLLKDILTTRRFDPKTNNFTDSEMRKYLEEFANKIAKIIGEENIVEHTVDLTADDGLKCYGSCKARMSLLTAQMYREHVYIIDNFKVNKWWWLATAFSTPKHNDSDWVKCVSSFGFILNDYFHDNLIGVRPFCILKSNIFVSK